MSSLQTVVNRVDNIPTLPQVVQKVITLVDNPQASSGDVARAVSADVALVSKILKVVNSAYYGLPRKVSTLSQATVILGFNAVKNIVLTASVFSVFKKNGTPSSYKREEFWKHSIGCAVSSRVLAKRIRVGTPEEAFVAGLVHDIGKIVLDQFLHDQFDTILKTASDKKISIRFAEKEVLGVDHTQIGVWLCDKWNFPRPIVDAVRYHHLPELAKENRKMVALVHLSDAIVRLENMGSGGDSVPPEINPQSWEMLQIPEEELGEIILEIKEEYEKATIFLELSQE